jgi:hypothetical protein
MRHMRRRTVGTGELLQFYTCPERFPGLGAHGVAFIAALLRFIRTSKSAGNQYRAHPSLNTLAAISRLSQPTLRHWIRYYSKSGWLVVRKRRKGKFWDSSEYDMTPAVEAINPALTVIEGGRK